MYDRFRLDEHSRIGFLLRAFPLPRGLVVIRISDDIGFLDDLVVATSFGNFLDKEHIAIEAIAANILLHHLGENVREKAVEPSVTFGRVCLVVGHEVVEQQEVVEGLTMRYSATPYDNLAAKRRNVEQRYRETFSESSKQMYEEFMRITPCSA